MMYKLLENYYRGRQKIEIAANEINEENIREFLNAVKA